MSQLPDSFVPGTTAWAMRVTVPVTGQQAGDSAKDRRDERPGAGAARSVGRSRADDESADGGDVTGTVFAAPAPTAPVDVTPPQTVPVNTLQEVVEFAALHRSSDGSAEFLMGLGAGQLQGMKVSVTALGQRRVSLKVCGGACTEEELSMLVSGLRTRGLDVVEALLL